jgi:phosphoribosylformimino-5-aminoimidazole carboxamide ribotide isomerase
VVRLEQGDLQRMTDYGDDPVETASRWLEAGARWLHVVNLDGAFGEADPENQKALAGILQCAGRRGAGVQFGGGLRSIAAIESAFTLGITRAVLGTLAVEEPEALAQALGRFGAERIAVGIDARDGQVQVRGWTAGSPLSAPELAARLHALGLRTVIFTEVSRDGTGRGLDVAATRALAERSGLDVIASGGVRSSEDIRAARRAGLAGVIIGRALYEGSLNLTDVLQENRYAG